MPAPSQILLVQLYSNGDCLYATTVARQIKNDFPGCRLSWLIATSCKNILALNPYVDDVLTTDEVSRDSVKQFRKLRKKILEEKKAGKWDKVFITQNIDRNLALYDGTIRGMIFRAYPGKITVPVQPVLVLLEEEKQNVKAFAENSRLSQFKNIILWEYAPQSGQSNLDMELVRSTTEKIVEMPGTCVILSSANRIQGDEKIIDASVLTLRENAALTHYCKLLIGCSSGITWISTSSAAKQLPMLQLLNPNAYFRNAPSVDFSRYGIPANQLTELVQFDADKIAETVKGIIENGIVYAKKKFNQPLPLQFRTTRKIVYNLLCYLQFRSIARHYRIMRSVYGRQSLFNKEFFISILAFPFRLLANKWRKMTR